MKTGKAIIAVAVAIWTIALVTMLIINNPYLNMIVFYFAGLIAMGVLIVGTEKVEKARKLARLEKTEDEK